VVNSEAHSGFADRGDAERQLHLPDADVFEREHAAIGERCRNLRKREQRRQRVKAAA
jgi:hypothetical protein